MKRYLWVVEIEICPKHWGATEGIGITKKHGKYELKKWQDDNPSHKERFRLRKYVPKEEK